METVRGRSIKAKAGSEMGQKESTDKKSKEKAAIEEEAVEEPSTTQPGDKDIPKHEAGPVETVDRGVGPTPRPQPAPDNYPPYLGISPYPPPDPNNGIIDSHFGYPFPVSPHLPYPPYNHPHHPVTSHTHEGRYHWPPGAAGLPPPPSLLYPPPHPGFASPLSPTQTELALLQSMHSRAASSQSAARLYWEQYRRQVFHNSSLAAQGAYNPANLPGYGAYGPGYGPSPLLSARSIFSENPASGSGSITLPSFESSRHNSPRPSIVGKTRKRALTHSPFSDYLDIESLTRSSEGSLQLAPIGYQSRSSSTASGSYGHLSAASLGATSPAQAPPNPFVKPHPTMPTNPYFHSMMHPHSHHHGGWHAQMHPHVPPTQTLPPPIIRQPKIEMPMGASMPSKDMCSSIVSSTMDQQDKRSKHLQEDDSPIEVSALDSDMASDVRQALGANHQPVEGEPDFVETNCHWGECTREFDTQDELVRHINQDHIQANKKAFVCRWVDCSREEKPFKAQYMLVVHMRRHTGEKPHRCTFEGCAKAYSRLENLKTHLRSHTGEKPYMCEFPGCTKAFSNASDRAKHQNRTHSNAKPYICKAPGCTKRYTDPSSLRKHVKTVHGADFYNNKRHKGSNGDQPSPGSGQAVSGTTDQVKDEPGSCKRQDCLGGSDLVTTEHNNEGHNSVLNSPHTLTVQGSPGSQGVSEGSLADFEDQVISHTVAAVLEADDEDDEHETILPATTVPLSTTTSIRASRAIQPNRLKTRLGKNAFPPLPPSSRKTGGDSSNLTELSGKVSQHKQRRRIMDLMNTSDGNSSRRDSNTSTLSSYMSSLRSDSSPAPFSSTRSSRQSSQLSSDGSSHFSIINSPYEYDISGNLPSIGRRDSVSSNISSMANQLRNTQLGSQTNLFCASSSDGNDTSPRRPGTTSSLPSPTATGRMSADRLSQGNAASFDNNKENWSRRTQNRTPQPHEIPNRDVRRASDPIPGAEKELSALKQLQRFNSLNSKNPLPIPDSMRSLRHKDGIESSRSSIATELSESQILGDVSVDEEALNQRLVDDDLIIPDDMKDFLNEQFQQADSTVPEYAKAHRVMQSPASVDSGREQILASSCMMQPRPPTNPPPGNRRPQSRQMVSPVSPPVLHQQQQNWGANTSYHLTPSMGPNSPSMQQMSHQNISCQSCHSCNSGMPTVQCQNCSMGPQMQQSSMNNMPQFMAHNPVNNMPCGNLVVTQNGMPVQQNYSNQWQNHMQHQTMQQNYMQHPNSMQQQSHGMQHNVMQQNQMTPMMQQQQMYANQQQMMANQNMGAQNMQMHPQQQQMGMHNMMIHKQERQSPQVQVPQISQSQIPPRAKAANRHTGRQQNIPMQQPCMKQYSASYDNGHNSCAMPNAMNYNNNQGQNNMPNYNCQQNNMTNHNPSTPVMCNNGSTHSLNAQAGCQHNNMPYQRAMSQPNSCMGSMGMLCGNPNPMNVQMSPNCNHVSSTSELHNRNMPPPNHFPDNYMSTSTENILDNLSSISMENMGGQVISPTALLNRSQTSSRMSTQSHPIIDTSNMVVNDMSSMLNALAEENKYLMR